MYCCDEMDAMVDRELIRYGPLSSLSNGRIVTEINTDYHLHFGEERPTYAGIHYCPWCGRALSRDLWNREKKK